MDATATKGQTREAFAGEYTRQTQSIQKDTPQGLSSISKSLKTLKFQSPSKQWLVEWLIGEALTLLDADDTN